MSYYRRNRRKPMAQINVVPYIDVTLVLLVIFMVTTPMMQRGVDIELPKASAKPVTENPEDQLVVSVDRAGQVFIDEDGPEAEPVADEIALANRVASMLADRESKQVFLRGDAGVDYGHIVLVMTALQAAGASGIGLITDPPPKNP